MTEEAIRSRLLELQDVSYGDFQSKLMPTVDRSTVIGVRIPALRALAKEIFKSGGTEEFLSALPHPLYEENQLHAMLISLMKDYDACLRATQAFLPYVDNWATCDTLLPKVFRRHRQELLPVIREWLASGKTYTVRFGVGTLMRYYLDEGFSPDYPLLVSRLRSQEYYVNMMIAWYFATALAKQYDTVLPLIESRALDPWTHNKAIQKAIESYRITPEQKAYLRTLKVRGAKN